MLIEDKYKKNYARCQFNTCNGKALIESGIMVLKFTRILKFANLL